MLDTIFGEKIPAPSHLCFAAHLKKDFINYRRRKKIWNRYEQATCKFVEWITLLFNNNAQFSSQINNFGIKNYRIYIYYKSMFNKT